MEELLLGIGDKELQYELAQKLLMIKLSVRELENY